MYNISIISSPFPGECFYKELIPWDSSGNKQNLELNATRNKGSPIQLLPAIQVNPDINK